MSQIAVCAPRVDLELLKILAKEACPSKICQPSVVFKRRTHCFVFVDENVSILQKRKIVNAIKSNSAQNEPPKNGNFNLANLEETDLHSFTTTNTMRFFNILDMDYSFLEIDPLQWRGLESYENALKAAQHLKFANDIAEHGVALIQYNMLHTRDEKMKQYLLQVVQEHRK